jgi:hypothetical protein
MVGLEFLPPDEQPPSGLTRRRHIAAPDGLAASSGPRHREHNRNRDGRQCDGVSPDFHRTFRAAPRKKIDVRAFDSILTGSAGCEGH